MISFACRCSHRIEVEQDMAGGMLQCPTCGILVDVPTLDELKNLDPDGTYHMDEVVAKPAKLRTTPHYEDNEQIDRRQTLEEFMEVDTVPPIDQAPKRLRPHYDPLTGELIRPVEVKDEAGRALPTTVPVKTLGYARPALSAVPGWWRPLVDAWRPESLLVWGIVTVVLLVHLNLLAMNLVLGIVYFLSFGLVVNVLLVSHFGVVIDDTGPGDRDELPTPLRQMSFSEDIWRPFFQVVLSIGLAFAPAIVLRIAWSDAPSEVMTALCVLGYVLLPAYALTALTSGYVLNLTPWRIAGTIRRIGVAYPIIVVCMTVALEGLLRLSSLYMPSLVGVSGLLPDVPIDSRIVELFERSALLLHAGLVVGLAMSMYLLHCACWMLGLCWRREHASFPWLMQQHMRRHGADTTSRLRTLRERRQEARVQSGMVEPTSRSR
jgi:hypothetical protein